MQYELPWGLRDGMDDVPTTKRIHYRRVNSGGNEVLPTSTIVIEPRGAARWSTHSALFLSGSLRDRGE